MVPSTDDAGYWRRPVSAALVKTRFLLALCIDSSIQPLPKACAAATVG
jgi:hypothetical protein